MTFRIAIATVALTILSACSNNVTGQKGGRTDLKTTIDSVSYAIGHDYGSNLRSELIRSSMDSMSHAAMAAGFHDALDSVAGVDKEKLTATLNAFLIKKQQEVMAAEQKKGEANIKAGEAYLTENGKRPGVITTETGLQYEVLQEGTGPKPTIEDVVKVHYSGKTIDGNEFDSSYKRGAPTEYPVKDWIKGFTEVLQIMHVGSRYKVFVPSNLAYGAQSPTPAIPAYSTLVFEMELVEIVKK